MPEIEHSHDMPEAGLVPVSEQQSPLFNLTAKHQNDIEQMTMSYMQRQKLPFTSAGLAVGKDVIGDALQKGMQEEGVVGIEKNTNIRKLIKEGLSVRSQITNEARAIINKNGNEIQNSSDAYIGPYALSKRGLIRASHEINRSSSMLLNASEGIIETEKKRKELLPQMAKAILLGLSKDQFPDVAIDLFPDPDSQAKLLRNAITSMIFRGNALPVLQIQDIQGFINEDKKFDSSSVTPFIEFLSQATGLEASSMADYIMELTAQTYNLFQKSERVSIENDGSGVDIGKRDKLYTDFGQRLLLLHPALEERELIVDKDYHSEGDYSLWNSQWSTLIDGKRIPGEEILLRARRLSVAQGKQGTRYIDGLGAWKEYKRADAVNGKRVGVLSRLIEQTDERLATVTIGTTPADELNIALATNVVMAYEYKGVKHAYNEDVRIIERAEQYLKTINDFTEEIKRENGGELPNEFASPLENYDGLKNRRRGSAKARQIKAELEAEDIFLTDFSSSSMPLNERERNFNFLLMDTPTIEQMLFQLSVERDRVEKFGGEIIPAECDVKDVGRHIDRTVGSLSMMQSYLLRTKKHENDKAFTIAEFQRLSDYRTLQSGLKSIMEKPFTQRGIPKLFMRYSLTTKMKALQKIVDARHKYEMSMKEEDVRKIITKEEWEQRTKKARIAAPNIDTPEEEAIVSSHLPEIKNMGFIIDKLHGFPFPPVIENNQTIVSWAQGMLRRLPSEPFSFPRKSHKGIFPELKRRDQIRALNSLIRVAESPLFPTDDLTNGMEMRDLLFSVHQRYTYLRSLLGKEGDERKFHKLHDTFREIAFQNYKRNLEGVRNKYERERNEVQSRDPKQTFLRKMIDLRLAIDEEEQA
jgi:hypothetical protein